MIDLLNVGIGVLKLDEVALLSIENLLNALVPVAVGAAFPKERLIELKMDGFGSLGWLPPLLMILLI